MAFPTSIDSYTAVDGTTLLSTGHAEAHNLVGSAVVALENKVGIGSGSAAANQILVGSGAGTSAWGSVWNNAQLGTANITFSTIGTPNVTGGTITAAILGTNNVVGGTISGVIAGAGTINGITLGTPVMDHFTSSGTTLPTTADRGLAPTVVTLTDAAGGTVIANAAAAQVFSLLLGTTAGTRTVGTPINPTDGQVITYRIKNNAGATGTVDFAAIFKFSGSAAGTNLLGTTANAINYYAFRYDTLGTTWDSQGTIVNII